MKGAQPGSADAEWRRGKDSGGAGDLAHRGTAPRGRPVSVSQMETLRVRPTHLPVVTGSGSGGDRLQTPRF